MKLVKGVLKNKPQIDILIERFSKNWRVQRMACVDRNVMRIAVFEMLFCPDIPPKVSINEAIDIGKKFGTEDSGAFINGIVDSIRIAIETGEIQVQPLEINTE
jgi:N utilization substance protein B